MNIQELQTAAFHQLPISFFILDNGGYGSIRATSNNYFDGRKVGCDPESGLQLPDYLAVSEALGVASQAIESKAELREGVSRALSTKKPTVTVVRIGAESFTHPRLSSWRLPDGRMETSPMHHLSPQPDGVNPDLEIARAIAER